MNRNDKWLFSRPFDGAEVLDASASFVTLTDRCVATKSAESSSEELRRGETSVSFWTNDNSLSISFIISQSHPVALKRHDRWSAAARERLYLHPDQ